MLEILDYRTEHQPWFEKLNRDWIEKHFWMEPIDFEVLQNPFEHILSKGGSILMAVYNKEIVGTVALKFVEEGIYEFTKMAVAENYQGKKIGLALAEAALEKAKIFHAHSVILYSSTKLEPALTLYRKIGFVEIPLDASYKRSDIKMEYKFFGLHVRHATVQDIDVLIDLGVETFRETFDELNSAEDMKAYLNKSFNRIQIEKELKEEGSTFFIAYDNHEPAGYARLRTNHNFENAEDANTIEVERIYVLKSQLGKQVGKKLMETCIAYAQMKKHTSIWLGVWERNYRAISFYEKWGFTQFSSHVFMLGSDAQTDILMRKKIN